MRTRRRVRSPLALTRRELARQSRHLGFVEDHCHVVQVGKGPGHSDIPGKDPPRFSRLKSCGYPCEETCDLRVGYVPRSPFFSQGISDVDFPGNDWQKAKAWLRYVRRATGFYEVARDRLLLMPGSCYLTKTASRVPTLRRSRNVLRVISRDTCSIVMLTSRRLFRMHISSSCADLASNPIFSRRCRNVQRNGKSYLRRKSHLFSTRVAHVAPKDGSLRLSRRTWRKNGPVCGLLHASHTSLSVKMGRETCRQARFVSWTTKSLSDRSRQPHACAY